MAKTYRQISRYEPIDSSDDEAKQLIYYFLLL